MYFKLCKDWCLVTSDCWWSSESNPQLLLFTGLYMIMEYCQFINIKYLFNIFIYLKYKNELLEIVVEE